jgi:hypothetical protein
MGMNGYFVLLSDGKTIIFHFLSLCLNCSIALLMRDYLAPKRSGHERTTHSSLSVTLCKSPDALGKETFFFAKSWLPSKLVEVVAADSIVMTTLTC